MARTHRTIAMYVFLMKLTGIPHVEREALAKRGAAYAAYQREVPIFFPASSTNPVRITQIVRKINNVVVFFV